MSDFDKPVLQDEKEKSYGSGVHPVDAVSDYRGVIFAGTKDGKNYGFYLPDSVVGENGEINLSDYVILTDEEHIALMDGQTGGKVIKFHKGAKPTLENQAEPDDEELASIIRQKRNSLITETEWRIQRYNQQLSLGIETTDSEGFYQSLLEYVQALRDVPLQTGFPKEVVWPELKA